MRLAPCPLRRLPSGWRATLLALSIGAAAVPAVAQGGEASSLDALDPTLSSQVQQLTLQASQAVAGTARVEISLGQLDPRLRLAPCQQIQASLPPNSKPWGQTRVGLRCVSGPTHWNVYMPVTVKVFARSLVAAATLPAGAVLTAKDLQEAEIDLAAAPGAAIGKPALAVGRMLARPLNAGEALRQTDLKARQWFAAGDTVQVLAVGSGYAVQGEGQALSNGLEGQTVRVRTESGRIISGQAVGERRIEVAL